MRPLALLLAALVLLFATASSGANPGPESARRTLQQSAVVAAPVDDVWAAFTTGDGIVKAWGVAKAEVDFRIGGTIKTHDEPDGVIGDGGTIVHTILAYEPGRMLALKTTRPPDTAPEFVKLICREGWFVVRLEPLTAHRTRFTATMMGFGDGPDFDAAFEFLRKSSTWAIYRMKDALRPPDEDSRLADTEKAFHDMVGEWEFSRPAENGSTIRGGSTFTEVFGGNLFVGTYSLGDEHSVTVHDHVMAFRDPETGVMRLLGVNQDGDVSYGVGRLESADSFVVDFDTIQAADRERVTGQVEYSRRSGDSVRVSSFLPVEKVEPRQWWKVSDDEYRRIKTEVSPTLGPAPSPARP